MECEFKILRYSKNFQKNNSWSKCNNNIYISPAFKSYSRTDFKVNIYNDRLILFWGSLGYLSDIYDIKFCE